MKKFWGSTAFRMIYLVFAVGLQLGILVAMFVLFRRNFAFYYVICVLLSLVVVLKVVNEDINPAYKLAWIIPILLFPVFGGLIYLLFGRVRPTKKEIAQLTQVNEKYIAAVNMLPSAQKTLRAIDESAAIQSQYLANAADAPLYAGTQTQYFAQGEEMHAEMLAQLEKAERFIFMEYFIIQEGAMWDPICDILTRKAAEGVDVRVVYDDFGCMFTLPANYHKVLEEKGVKCCVFNRFNSIMSSRFNNRDHRKICVIDGNVGFTGGINLADEYINAVTKHGHWKDTAVMLQGRAVWSLTALFLALWGTLREVDEDFMQYRPTQEMPDDGFIAPYNDMPLDNERVGETTYLNLIYRAKRSVYICTPYLIIDNEMITALRTATKNGVDVRIVTPGKPDKKIVYQLTRSYYDVLVQDGVKIYEYTPGFLHAKSFVIDGEIGVVGTINLDYRSLYLHYECAAWMYKTHAVQQLAEDFEALLPKCTPITPDAAKSFPFMRKLWFSAVRIFAPLC